MTQLLSIATALPSNRVTQREAAEMALRRHRLPEGRGRAVAALYRRSGVRARHTAIRGRRLEGFYPPARGSGQLGPGTAERMEAYAELAGELAAAAAGRALTGAGVGTENVTHLVTVSCTGFRAPGVDVELIGSLGLPPTVERVHVGFMGCHGSINGLRVAGSIAAAHPEAVVLLCAVELCTLHFAYDDDPQRMVSNALFADGAAAVVLKAGSGRPDLAPEKGGWRLVATGSCVLPDSTGDMTWRIGDHGFRMTLSPRVPGLIRKHLRPWLDGWLDRQGLLVEEVGSWALHPGGPRILEEVGATLGLERDALSASRQVLADCGNMSSPTVLFILERLLRERAPRPCVILAFGPGLTAEAALLD